MKFFWLLVTLWISTTSYAEAPKPQIFTGILYHQKLKTPQLTRLHLINYIKPNPSGETPISEYTAVVTLHWGNFTNPEYVSLYYDKVLYNSQTGEFSLLPNNNGGETAKKLPTIRFHFNGTTKLEGTFVSPTAGLIGNLTLESGETISSTLLPDPSKALQPLAGLYQGNCYLSALEMKLQTVEIVSSRLPFNQNPPEAAQEVLNYIGTGSCDSGGITSDPLNCATFETGIYNFYQDEVKFYDNQKSLWACNRAQGGGLVCDSPWVSKCELKRKTESDFTSAPITPAVSNSISEQVTTRKDEMSLANSAEKPCGSWDGVYHGILKHRVTGKEQYINLNFTTILISGPQPPVRCAILGSGDLVFGNDYKGSEHFSTTFPQMEFIPSRPEVAVFSEPEGDVFLQMAQGSSGRIEGNWYSKRYGLVGSFTASTDENQPSLGSKTVSSLGGKFDLPGGSLNRFTVIATPASPQLKLSNPFQLNVSGWWQILTMKSPIEAASYDYFNNQLVVQTESMYFVGEATGDSLKFHAIGRVFQSISQTGQSFIYKRKP